MKRTIAGLAILAALAGFYGCQRIDPRAQAQQQTGTFSHLRGVTPESEQESAQKAVHYCAGKTKQGVRCRKHVKAEGDYCWMHKDQDTRKK